MKSKRKAGACALAFLLVFTGLTVRHEGHPPQSVSTVATTVDYTAAFVAADAAQRQMDAFQVQLAKAEADRVQQEQARIAQESRDRAARARAARARTNVRAASVGPAVVVPSGPFDCMANHGAKWRMPSQALAHQCWDGLLAKYAWNQATAFSKLWCESGGNPWAANSSGARGLMQILSKDGAGHYIGSFDPTTNIDQAWGKYEGAGHSWSPWVC
jgi:soluble lytic murein transglycosylase-like protein